ncbi:MAG TPA: DUF6600 domain-containing protein [Thermoanaerobaculia bacterium]|nr:DUF6600 domain-containing protein [Thermoanaerobaculia bacterium]
MTKNTAFRTLTAAAGFLLAAFAAFGQDGSDRSAYSYIRSMTGEATVNSRWNGAVDAKRNMPLSVGDEISVTQAGRVEVGMADGNVLFLGGGTRASFDSLSDQQGEQDQFTAIQLIEGEAVLSGLGVNEEQIPRIDTDDATIYISRGANVRVNADPRRGTVVIGRSGSAEVRARAGTYTVKAGQYLMVRGDEEPEIGKGSFSRDRFDLWVADRLESVGDTRSASVRYVGDQYAADVSSLDGYGDWEYDSAYGGNVWSPRVDADWTPYSYGSWYYTPVGLTWWSYDPWGWYPFHYGNWFYARSRWCWAPGYAYSPAWVYWSYSPGYVGWCPVGYYSYGSPWWGSYHSQFGWHARSNIYFPIHGSFSTRRMDLRAWNFVNSGSFGSTTTRASVIPGSRIGDRLGAQVAVSSRPIVVNARDGGVREAIRNYVREAPRTIERASVDSERYAPVLARERTLPADTVTALRERAVVAERGRLSGQAAAEIAPRGSIVERSRTAPTASLGTRETATPGRGVTEQRSVPDSMVRDRGNLAGAERSFRMTPQQTQDWRSRGGAALGESRDVSRERVQTENAPPAARAEGWRSRPEAPPAQRVIEGAVPGHRYVEPRSDSWRGREFRPETSSQPPARVERVPAQPAEGARPPRSERYERPNVERQPYSLPPPRVERQVERPQEVHPAPRVERPPQPQQQQQAPRAEGHRDAPQRQAPAPAEHPNRGRPN